MYDLIDLSHYLGSMLHKLLPGRSKLNIRKELRRDWHRFALKIVTVHNDCSSQQCRARAFLLDKPHYLPLTPP